MNRTQFVLSALRHGFDIGAGDVRFLEDAFVEYLNHPVFERWVYYVAPGCYEIYKMSYDPLVAVKEVLTTVKHTT